MRSPCLVVVVCFGSGVLIADGLELAWLAAAAGAMVVFLLGWALARGRRWVWGVAWGLVGIASYGFSVRVRGLEDVRELTHERACWVEMRGRLAERVVRRSFPAARAGEAPEVRSSAVLELVELRRADLGWQPARGRVVCRVRGAIPTGDFFGQWIEVEGVLNVPERAVAPGLFDARQFFKRKGVYRALQIDAVRAWRARPAGLYGEGPGWADRFQEWAMATLTRGLPLVDEALRLNWAMVLGVKGGMEDESADAFMRSGTMHVFAISGLHIALLAQILADVFLLVRVPRVWSAALAIPLIWAYTLATGGQASAVRSAVMMTVVLGGRILARPSNLVNSLALAALVILVWDPQQLFQAGFQLSFTVVLSLVLASAGIERLARAVVARDPLVPRELQPAWRERLRGLAWTGVQAVGVSAAAWIGSLPLIAHYFHLVTPVSVIANLAVVPLSSLALMSGLGSLVCGDVWAPVGEVLNHAAWLFMAAMVWVSERTAHWPGASWNVVSPGIVATAILTLAAGVWMMEGRGTVSWGWRRRVVCGVALSGVGGLLWWNEAREVSMTVLAMGRGGCGVVCGPGATGTMMIGTGDAHVAERLVGRYLQVRGWDRVPTLVLPQADVAHCGGVEALRLDWSMEEVVVGPQLGLRSPVYRRAVAEAASRGVLRRVNPGDWIAGWQVVWSGEASGRRPSRAEDVSVVLRGQVGAVSVLWLGALSLRGQAAMLAGSGGREHRADVLVVGCGGDGGRVLEGLLEAVAPELVVVSDGVEGGRSRLAKEARAAWVHRRLPTVLTTEAGSVVIRGEGRGTTADR